MEISYWFHARKDGAMMTIELFRSRHSFLGKVIPEIVLFKFFCWYGRSKIGMMRAKRLK